MNNESADIEEARRVLEQAYNKAEGKEVLDLPETSEKKQEPEIAPAEEKLEPTASGKDVEIILGPSADEISLGAKMVDVEGGKVFIHEYKNSRYYIDVEEGNIDDAKAKKETIKTKPDGGYDYQLTQEGQKQYERFEDDEARKVKIQEEITRQARERFLEHEAAAKALADGDHELGNIIQKHLDITGKELKSIYGDVFKK